MEQQIDMTKRQPTLDEVINSKLDPIVDQINQVNQNVFEDVNKALNKTYSDMDQMKKELITSIELLWSLLNETNIRSAAVEAVLIKNGLNPQDVIAEANAIKEQYKEHGMKEFDVSKLIKPQDNQADGGLV